jgi:hypothetical protein
MSKPVSKDTRETARYYRSLGLICRQQAILHPEASWNWLSEAERWEDMAIRMRDGAEQRVPAEPSRIEKLA